MDRDHFADSSRFIPGIYNYCDRWCERCTLALRCRSFAAECEDILEREQNDVKNETFWSAFVVDADAENSVDAEVEALREREGYSRNKAQQHPAAKISREYDERVTTWMDTARSSLERAVSALEQRGQDEEEGMAPHIEAVDLEDALAVVRWYQTFIHVKLMRALRGQERGDEVADTYGFPRDSDGSAKVALMATERSMGAWRILQKYLPDQVSAIRDIMTMLTHVRVLTETAFPEARDFKRPGFDDGAERKEDV